MQTLYLSLPVTVLNQKRCLSIVLLSFLFFSFLTAQQRAVVSVNVEGEKALSSIQDIPLREVKPFLAYSVTWQNPDSRVWIRFAADGKFTTSWLAIVPDAHADPAAGKVVGRLSFTAEDQQQFQLRYQGNGSEEVAIHFFNPGPARVTSDDLVKPMEKTVTCPCSQPGYVARTGWCLASDCPPNPGPEMTAVTHLIVHHTAGTNTAGNWAAVVRAIWDYHVNTNGWADIGYNWLIDPNGVIYEGRGNDILGAHFCGSNTNTMGVCVLGDFTEIEPTTEAQNTLRDLLAWKSCDIGADPLGFAFHPPSASTLANISGHRDGCATACPGDMFYPLLPALRQYVADFINTSCSGLPGPTALTATVVSDQGISLNWTDNSDAETGFELERSEDESDDFALLATLPANTLEYLDETVSPNTTYFYRVRATGNGDVSDYSNIEEAFTMLSGTANAQPLTGVRLVPNPAGAMTQLMLENSLRGSFTLELRTVPAGKLLRLWSFQKEGAAHQAELPLAELPAGVYLLRLLHAEGAVSLRLVRQ